MTASAQRSATVRMKSLVGWLTVIDDTTWSRLVLAQVIIGTTADAHSLDLDPAAPIARARRTEVARQNERLMARLRGSGQSGAFTAQFLSIMSRSQDLARDLIERLGPSSRAVETATTGGDPVEVVGRVFQDLLHPLLLETFDPSLDLAVAWAPYEVVCPALGAFRSVDLPPRPDAERMVTASARSGCALAVPLALAVLLGLGLASRRLP